MNKMSSPAFAVTPASPPTSVTPHAPHEKGRVAQRVGWVRRQYCVPLPPITSFAERNTQLLAACVRDAARCVAGAAVSIGTAWQQEQPLLRSLPAMVCDYAVTRTVRFNRYSQIACETDRYAVPADHARAVLTLQARPFSRTSLHEQHILAGHPRGYARHQDILDPLHYLPLLRQRPGAFDHAKPLRQWRERWPADYDRLLARFQERHPDGRGVRAFVEVWYLHGHYLANVVAEAIAYALRYGCRDAASVLTLLHQ